MSVAALGEQKFGPTQTLPRSHTGWHVYAVAAIVGLIEFGAGVLLDWWLLPGRRPVLYSDAFTGLVAALLAFVAVRYYDRRRQQMALRLAVIADVNHHVRNAMTAVMLKIQLKNDPELMEITNNAVERIDWALREVLPRDVRMR